MKTMNKKKNANRKGVKRKKKLGSSMGAKSRIVGNLESAPINPTVMEKVRQILRERGFTDYQKKVQ